MNAILKPEILIPGAPIGGGTFTGHFFIGAQPWGLITAPKAEGEIRIEYMKGRKRLTEGADSYCDAMANTIDLEKVGSPLGYSYWGSQSSYGWARAVRRVGLPA